MPQKGNGFTLYPQQSFMSHRWNEEEQARLVEVAGDRPWPLAVGAYNTWAEKFGYNQRTSLALERRANKLGVYRKSEGSWITLGAVSEILGVDRATPLRWVRRGLISSWRNGNQRSYPHYVHRREFRRLARQSPCFFRPYQRERLVMLFDSQEIADLVYEQCPACYTVAGRTRAVQCVETGKKYDSIKEAALAVYVTPARLRAVLDTSKTASGYHWRSLAAKQWTGVLH